MLTFDIDQISATNLVDTGGRFDKQDPCLRIKLGKNISLETQRYKHSILSIYCCPMWSPFCSCFRLVDAGTNAKFPEKFNGKLEISDYESIEVAHRLDQSFTTSTLYFYPSTDTSLDE